MAMATKSLGVAKKRKRKAAKPAVPKPVDPAAAAAESEAEAAARVKAEAEAAAAKEAKEKEVQRARISSVQALSALVLAFPYDVPPAVPPAIALLARHSALSPAADAIVRHTFTDFKRTHADMWERQRDLFEREQLDAFNDIMVSPDYFC
jgi:hypothetical protein